MVCVEFSLQWFARSLGVLPCGQPCAMLLCGLNVPKQCANVSVKAKKFMTESLWFHPKQCCSRQSYVSMKCMKVCRQA